MKEYKLKVTSVVYLTVEADSEEEAMQYAGETAWTYDADDINIELDE